MELTIKKDKEVEATQKQSGKNGQKKNSNKSQLKTNY